MNPIHSLFAFFRRDHQRKRSIDLEILFSVFEMIYIFANIFIVYYDMVDPSRWTRMSPRSCSWWQMFLNQQLKET